MKEWREKLLKWFHRCRWIVCHCAHILGQIIYGMTIYGIVRELKKEQGEIERIFVLFTFSDMLGIPLLTPYYTLRLLPFVMPRLTTWKDSMLRERDLTDLCDQDIV